ncbi:L-aminoadipate-semialdehyde dehydrogenase-phosphopantetheinyl transferase [Agrilus planipennis]|uniref:L-aminoadipate-semialdehyde dehydrogenase-phosphopantetheinyl transferase n=1 Tax=Agrilus planipennis TaxID=224129 RepID=A0A7F5QX32_AGRPL|nr:L-aminoadipate-semialdehyde dehydrogenase-phosphopantetheinyl transferase [Agrilus planipennis]
MSSKSVRWTFNISKWQPTVQDIKLATSCIQPEEKARLAKFVFKNDFKASLIGRLMMRKFVHDVTKVPYNSIKFSRDNKGKPVVISPETVLALNVSHQGDFAVLAGEAGLSMIGADIMKVEYTGGKSLSEFFRIMSRQFSVSEWITIKSCKSEDEQLGSFYRHWCLKESYVKAIGVGITISLQDLSFKIKTPCLSEKNVITDTELYVKNEKQNWIFEESLINNKHIVAVALNANEWTGDKKVVVTRVKF